VVNLSHGDQLDTITFSHVSTSVVYAQAGNMFVTHPAIT